MILFDMCLRETRDTHVVVGDQLDLVLGMIIRWYDH